MYLRISSTDLDCAQIHGTSWRWRWHDCGTAGDPRTVCETEPCRDRERAAVVCPLCPLGALSHVLTPSPLFYIVPYVGRHSRSRSMFHRPQRQSECRHDLTADCPCRGWRAHGVRPRRARVPARQRRSDVGDKSGWVIERGADGGKGCVSGWCEVEFLVVAAVVGGWVCGVGVFGPDSGFG